MGGQNNIQLVSVSPPDGNVRANDVEEGTDASLFKEVTTNRLYKLEELMGTVIQRLDKIAHTMNKAEIRTTKSN